MQALVSIIIPTYNRAHLIGETLDSVLVQSYQNWECIIVDDGSTDYTAELLEFYCIKDNRIKSHKRPNYLIKGSNSCRNFGFNLSEGEFINWLDDDDVLLEDFLKIKMLNIKENLDLIICSGFISDFNLLNHNPLDLHLENKTSLYVDFASWKLQILTPSVLFRKSFLLGKDLFLDKLSRGQEAELFSRLFFKLDKDKFELINKPLFYYRQHKDSKTAQELFYVNEHKESQSFFYTENLKKGILLNEKELSQLCYNNLIEYFFEGIQNGHISNSKYILKNLIFNLYKTNLKLCFELLTFSPILFVYKRGSYNIQRRLKNWKLNF